MQEPGGQLLDVVQPNDRDRYGPTDLVEGCVVRWLRAAVAELPEHVRAPAQGTAVAQRCADVTISHGDISNLFEIWYPSELLHGLAGEAKAELTDGVVALAEELAAANHAGDAAVEVGDFPWFAGVAASSAFAAER